ncbi:MAG: hypothetical protein ACTS68_02205 [Candidatus Hodgkinia cicadicola]
MAREVDTLALSAKWSRLRPRWRREWRSKWFPKVLPHPRGVNRLARRRHELTITQTIDAAAGSSVAFVRRINWVVSRMVCVVEGEAPTCHGFGAQISIRRS